MDESGFDTWVQAKYGLNATDLAEVKSLYDPSVYEYPSELGSKSQWWWTGVRVATDQVPEIGTCGTRWLARKLARAGSQVYAYFFARPCQTLMLPIGCHPGSHIIPHGGEMTYVFGDEWLTLTPEDRGLMHKVSSYWSSFATSGVPSVDGQPVWPVYDPELDIVMRFDAKSAGGIVAQSKTREAACDFWDNHFGARFGPNSGHAPSGLPEALV